MRYSTDSLHNCRSFCRARIEPNKISSVRNTNGAVGDAGSAVDILGLPNDCERRCKSRRKVERRSVPK